MFAGGAAVGAGVEEDVVPERAGVGRLGSIERKGTASAGRGRAADIHAVVEEMISAQGFVDAYDAGGRAVACNRAQGISNAGTDGNHIVAIDRCAAGDSNAIDFGRGAVGRSRQSVNQVSFHHVGRAARKLDAGDHTGRRRVGVA